MNRPSAEQLPSFDDFAACPSPYLKAMLLRLRIEMFSFAKAMQGELLDEFWRAIDELQALRPKSSGKSSGIGGGCCQGI